MGVDIETYRGRIGGFKGSIGCDVVTVPCNVNFSSGMNAFGAVVFIGLLLIMGGIEPNPGPPQKDTLPEESYEGYLRETNTNPEERESLLKMKTTYDEKAVAALEKMSKTNLSRTTKCLIRKRWCAFGDTSALLLAKDNASFLAHPAVQRKLTDIWMSPFNTTYLRNGYLKLGICFLCPFLAHCFLQPSVHEVNSEPSQTKTKDHRNKLIKWLHSANNFICCPCTIVVYNIVATIIFLCIYAYYLIFEMEQKTTGFDIVLIIWVASLFVEELRQLITKRMNYFHDVWNIIDVLSITLFAIGEGLRLSKCCDTFGNIVLAVDFIFFTIRMFQTVSCLETFGPKLVMIGKMMQDLLYFLLLLSVMVMSYGISTQAILYPKSPVVWKTALMTFKKPFWNIFGELSLDEITGNADCTNNKSQWMNGSLPRCPTEKSTYVVPVMLGVYMLMVHVLLLNLLIAIFSKTYTKVQLKAYQHWCKLRYELILEYSERPSLCPPLIVFCHSKWMDGSLPRCPIEQSQYVVPVMLAVYMLIIQVLLINLLITKVIKTYTEVEEEAFQHW
ncbi:TRPM3-like protein, partial [Mya arenaria]